MRRRGIILAGGTGTRLYPATHAVSKQLVPVYDKPMIYYPLATLMLAGIREILVITTPTDRDAFRRALGDGSRWGVSLQYAVQPRPEGIAQGLVIAEDFLDGCPSALILGDNLFYGHGLTGMLRRASAREEGAAVFAYWVKDPERYGVLAFDGGDRPVGIEEKPARPPSHWAVTGLYLYDERAPSVARSLEPSERGELEITDVNRWYLERSELRVHRMGRGYAWLDTGTHEALLQAGNFIQMIEERQGLKVCCPEEVAWRVGFIDSERLRRLAEPLVDSGYGEYLLRLARDGDGGEEGPADSWEAA